ncbi:MAG: DUF2721 domain-containing protein [Gemmatales bacterium]
MELIAANPFAVLTFIAAPAILTNASSVSAMATSNRIARATDRTRQISTELENRAGKSNEWVELNIRLLQYAEKRLHLIVRALTAFYFSVGSFAAASLISVFGTGLFTIQFNILAYLLMAFAILAGLSGVAGLVIGSWLLVLETRITLKSLAEETRYLVTHHQELTQKAVGEK